MACPDANMAARPPVVGVRKRERRKKSDGLLATIAEATSNVDPVVVLVMCLLRRPCPTTESLKHAGALSENAFGNGGGTLIAGLFCAAEGGIKRITTGVEALPVAADLAAGCPPKQNLHSQGHRVNGTPGASQQGSFVRIGRSRKHKVARKQPPSHLLPLL